MPSVTTSYSISTVSGSSEDSVDGSAATVGSAVCVAPFGSLKWTSRRQQQHGATADN